VFERFTQPARQAIVLAQDEARELGRGSIGTGEILAGLTRDERGLARRILDDAGLTADTVRAEIASGAKGKPVGLDAEALATIGIDLDAVRASAEEAFGPGALEHPRAAASGRIPFEDGAKRALELALREAVALHHDYVGTEHLLLGVARAEGTARRVLEAHGLTYERLRRVVLDELAA
jgi:ATP-dependent Clp protease ATP-binding subunit ClpA